MSSNFDNQRIQVCFHENRGYPSLLCVPNFDWLPDQLNLTINSDAGIENLRLGVKEEIVDFLQHLYSIKGVLDVQMLTADIYIRKYVPEGWERIKEQVIEVLKVHYPNAQVIDEFIVPKGKKLSDCK